MGGIEKLQQMVVKFRDARDWKQFHTPKDMAISLLLEAGEILEHFQWKTESEQWERIKSRKEDIADELGDAFYWILLLAHDLEIDLEKAFTDKLTKSNEKYPIEKSKGKHTKYTEL
jgi:NTP pyrophosphatase (non-canonical NTP hydrolase)